MRYLSICSGVGTCKLASEHLDWDCAGFAEIDPHASAVLEHHWPGTPNFGDLLAHDWMQQRGQVDLVCGSPPCQAFSIAGLRRSLDDDRGDQDTLVFAIQDGREIEKHQNGLGVSDDGSAYTLDGTGAQAVAFAENQPLNSGGGKPGEGYAAVFHPRVARNGRGAPDDVASSLTGEAGRTGKGDSAQCVVQANLGQGGIGVSMVRRLTPL